MKGKIKGRILAFVSDLLIATLLLGGIYGVNYLIPQKGISARPMEVRAADGQKESRRDSQRESQLASQKKLNGLPTTKVSLDTQDWHEKFADKFTDRIVSTDTSYTSPNVSVKLTYYSCDTNRLDKTQDGNHEKYGTNISYVLADIYVGADEICSCGKRDSYSNSRHRDNVTIIRNGVIYRAQQTDMETCVLNWDGTMKIYNPEEMDTQKLIDSGAYQSWIFGPSLLDGNGKAKTTFRTWPYIEESHPRTAIGYYEPGHYCLLVVDGRKDNSRGMFLDEMAGLFEQLGCKAAYNLDGGHCSFMTLKDQVVNHPYKSEHKVEDGIFITEGV